MTAELRDELIAAQALHEAEESWNDHAWDHLPDGMRAEFTRQARAVLRALASPSAASAGVRDAGREMAQAEDHFADAGKLVERLRSYAETCTGLEPRQILTAAADHLAALTARPDGETLTERQRDNLEMASRYREGERETVAIPATPSPTTNAGGEREIEPVGNSDELARLREALDRGLKVAASSDYTLSRVTADPLHLAALAGLRLWCDDARAALATKGGAE